jgi:hypothetical protein
MSFSVKIETTKEGKYRVRAAHSFAPSVERVFDTMEECRKFADEWFSKTYFVDPFSHLTSRKNHTI